MLRLFLSGFVLLLLSGCDGQRITNVEDYNKYLQPQHNKAILQQQKADLDFWQQQLQRDTGSYVMKVKLAYALLGKFSLTGNVSELHSADSLLSSASASLRHSDPELLHMLAQVAATKHEFEKAETLNNQARSLGTSSYTYNLIGYDVAMELGRTIDAHTRLARPNGEQSFDYLVRLARYQDQQGDLASAIRTMEQAALKIKGKKGLECWTLANLGDMYGHAGRIGQAYGSYLEVLKKDPAYLHALKGIAWIAYAHDGDIEAAEKIIRFLQSEKHMPESGLLLAEFAGMKKNKTAQRTHMEQFIKQATEPAAGALYNKYLIEAYIELGYGNEAVRLAQHEMEARPTVQAASWLALALLETGSIKESLSLVRSQVHGRSFEPEVLLAEGRIEAAAGDRNRARKALSQALESSFELGPAAAARIRELLQEIEVSSS